MRPPPVDAWGPDDDTLKAMRAFGAPAADIERVAQAIETRREQASKVHTAVQVYQDNRATWQAWLDLGTQWYRAGMTGVQTGLNYASVVAWMQINVPRRKRKGLLAELAVMERAALEAFNEIRKAEEEKG